MTLGTSVLLVMSLLLGAAALTGRLPERRVGDRRTWALAAFFLLLGVALGTLIAMAPQSRLIPLLKCLRWIVGGVAIGLLLSVVIGWTALAKSRAHVALMLLALAAGILLPLLCLVFRCL